MVQDANVKRMHTEKLLAESQSSVSIHSETTTACSHHVICSLDREREKQAPAGVCCDDRSRCCRRKCRR